MRLELLLLVTCAIGLNAVPWQTGSATAQSPASEETEYDPSPHNDGARITERELKTYYLEREDGSLKAFFNIPFEEWDELYKLYKGLQQPDQPPRFVLRSFQLTGEVKGDYAFLTVTAKAVVQADGWVRIPLRLNQALLLPGEEENASGDNLLEFDQDSGLVWRVNGKAGKQYSLNVKIGAKLRQLGAQTHLELSIPKATTSRLQLVVPETDIEASANENAFLLNTAEVKPDKTRIDVDGIGGQLRLVWQERETQPKSTSIFSATAEVRISFASQRRLHAEAVLRPDVSSGELESLIVQLPPQMRHTAVEQPGVDVQLLPITDPRLKGARSDCQHLELTMQHPTTDPIDLRLNAHRTIEPAEIGELVEVAGFEVLDAVSQSGTISLATDSQWAFQWAHDSAVEQIEDVSDTKLRQGVTASFFYSSQPYSFRVKISRKERRIHVEPRYELVVKPSHVVLNGVVSYRLRGAETQAVTLDLSGWDLKQVAINNEDVFDAELPDSSKPIEIPLDEADESLIRDFDLSLSAELYLPADGEFTAELPKLESTSQTPAEVVIRHAENVELVPLLGQSQGLTVVDDSMTAASATSSSNSVVYRGWSKPDRLVYAASVRLRPPEIVVLSEGRVTLRGEEAEVIQDLTYRVLYQSVPQLLLKLPTDIVESDGFQLSLADNPVQPQQVSKEAGRSVVGVVLDDPQPGSYRLTVEFRVPVKQVREAAGDWFAIPLATAVFDGEGRVSEATLTVEDRAGRDLRADEAWTNVTSVAEEGSAEMRLRSSAPPADTLRLQVSGLPLLSERDSIVQVAWLQTWISDARRSDRLAVRLVTSRDQVRIRLPISAELEDVALEKRQVTKQVIDEAGDVIVKLPPNEGGDSRIVEIWYSVPIADDGPGQYVLDLPQLIDANWTRRFYWQLVLPRDEHLFLGAKELNSEFSWNWQVPPFGRRPRFDQRALEQFVEASEQLPLPESTNKYLFSSQGAVARVQFTTASRAQILLAAAVTVFVVGLLLIYVPSLRHPASLLLLCVAVAVIGLLFPHPTIQLAQLSAIGLLFVLLAFVLKWLLARSRTGPAILHGSSLSSIESVTTEMMLGPVDSSSQASTQALISQTSDSAAE